MTRKVDQLYGFIKDDDCESKLLKAKEKTLKQVNKFLQGDIQLSCSHMMSRVCTSIFVTYKLFNYIPLSPFNTQILKSTTNHPLNKIA